MKNLDFLKNKIKHLEKLVYKDELTGAYNRRGFLEISKKFLKEIKTNQTKEKRKKNLIKNCSLILFDIDNFKKINDVFGHSAGDKALKVLCLEIKNRIRDLDIIGRWGGEEIVVLLIGADKMHAYQVADYIRKKIENKKIKINGKIINFTISGGVADFKKYQEFQKVFDLADQALYKAKKTGKNKIVVA
ncbi:MAG: GGDEF domain-containing protein [Minisyncoccia bacterium]